MDTTADLPGARGARTPPPFARAGRPARRPAAPTALLLAGVLLLSPGCSGVLTGAGSADYSCPGPGAGLCRSISEIHGMGREDLAGTAGSGETDLSVTARRPGAGDAAPGGAPGIRRTPARVLRLWIAPHVDDDGDHVGAQHIHMVVDVGGWAAGDPAP